VIVAVMNELRERRPRVHLGTRLVRPSRGRIADESVAIELAGGKETLDGVRHVREVRSDLIEADVGLVTE
jgi:hypothetical protein